MPSLARVRAVLTGWSGSPGLSTFYFRGLGPNPTQAEVNDAAARVRAFFDAIKASYPAAWRADVNAQVDLVDDATGFLVTSSVATPTPATVAGTSVGSLYAPGISALLVHDTGFTLGGRRLRGRTYLGILSVSAVAAGQFNSADRTTHLTAAAGLIAATPTSVKHAVWSRPAPGRSGSSVNVVAYSMPLKLAHLRSRRD